MAHCSDLADTHEDGPIDPQRCPLCRRKGCDSAVIADGYVCPTCARRVLLSGAAFVRRLMEEAAPRQANPNSL